MLRKKNCFSCCVASCTTRRKHWMTRYVNSEVQNVIRKVILSQLRQILFDFQSSLIQQKSYNYVTKHPNILQIQSRDILISREYWPGCVAKRLTFDGIFDHLCNANLQLSLPVTENRSKICPLFWHVVVHLPWTTAYRCRYQLSPLFSVSIQCQLLSVIVCPS